ncbi:hypothetical protein [Azoarcus olearius]|uniref:Uncharacterized protein n=1 Tax=Azoarcus sp. (strain BH72) TaxID=418699 RepID=A1K4R9_AZOSB|nr:hypothetical protein [Azoarcus olearius]ANQ84375.1 hypothetical protein dqs_1322 [Azoarcus olearius]CAL93824.1 hypothetical protein predicted by Glimmer/Critica [Azoarcus olearius]
MSANLLTAAVLGRENDQYRGTAGVSSGNRDRGFRPAFLDGETGRVFLSCHADGRPAPFHLLDGLPAELTIRDPAGRVRGAKASLRSGFVLDDRFYSREEAAQLAVAE